MTFENVTIEAKCELLSLLVNPKTGRGFLLIVGLIVISFVFGFKSFKSNRA